MNLDIPGKWFSAEEREGFLVSEEMKRCWAAEMKMLLIIGDILDRHGLRWYADCGTLLGAARHRGFVPWDDDIDIIMPRADYQRVWPILKRELPSHYVLYCSQLDNTYREPWGGVANRAADDTLDNAADAAITEAYYDSPYQHAIDIFALDFLPADGPERDVLSTIYIQLYSILWLYDGFSQWEDVLSQVAQVMEEIAGVTLPREKNALRSALWNLNDALASLYTREDAGGADITYFWANTGRRPRPADAYDHTVMLPFEMIELPAPAGFAEVLRTSYGDAWMTPVRNTGAHAYPYFAATKNAMQELLHDRLSTNMTERCTPDNE